MKNKLPYFILFTFLINLNFSYAQKTKAVVRYHDGTVEHGEVKKFYVKPSFEKINPWIIWTSLFKKDTPLHQYTRKKVSQEDLKFKPEGQKKFLKIPIDSIYDVTTTAYVKMKNGTKQPVSQNYRAIVAEKLYNVKPNKNSKFEKGFLPVLKETEKHVIFGTIFPIRNLFVFYPPGLVLESTPGVLGHILIQNKDQNVTIHTDLIYEEKFLTAREVEQREKSNRNRNYNSLEVLFGDCPEAQQKIKEFYFVRESSRKERRKASIEHNKSQINGERIFKSTISNNRSLATIDLYTSTHMQELIDIIKIYEKNCGKIEDVYHPKNENYEKSIDIINDIIDKDKI